MPARPSAIRAPLATSRFTGEPFGDELCYDDGRIAGTGAWYPFLQYRSHARVAPSLKPWNIGYSDVEADHWLVLETAAGNVWIAEIADALAILLPQHPPTPPIRMVEVARFREKIRIAVAQPVAPEQMGEMKSRQREELQRMLAFCDAWAPPLTDIKTRDGHVPAKTDDFVPQR